MSIKKDLVTGDVGEILVGRVFENAGFDVEKNDGKDAKLSDYDLKVSRFDKDGHFLFDFTIEVKYDIYSAKSGNIAIEYFNSKSNKPSGLTATKADFWVQVTPDKGLYIVTVEKLKRYIDIHPPFRTITAAGDGNADLFLYKSDLIFFDVFCRCDALSSEELNSYINKELYSENI